MKQYEISEKLKRFEANIVSTIKPTLEIQFKRDKCELWESKVGGQPYLEKGEEYPTSESGTQHRLLAQINFEEMPKVQGFPEKGVLQFFIEPDDVYGLDFDDNCKQDTFKVKYIANVIKDKSKLVEDFSFLEELEEDWYLPFTHEGRMNFTLTEMPIVQSDYRFDSSFRNIKFTEEEQEVVGDELYTSGSRIGGYPYFTQYDPREGCKENEFDTLLLQLDLDDECGIMFGDSGVCNFFISKEDLDKLDFSNVMYTWDCC